MATTPGNNAAYSQLTPLENSVPRMMEYQDQRGFQKRQEDREIDLLEQQKQEKALQRKQALREKFAKNLQNYDTGSRSLNEINGEVLMKAMDEMIPLIETLDNPKTSERDKLKAQLKLQNLQDLPNNLKMVTDFYTKQADAYNKGIAAGTLWRDPIFEKTFQEGFENVRLELDDNGLPMVGFVDKNGDGKNDIFEVQPFEEIKNMYSPFQFQPKFDYDSLLGTATQKIQPESNQSDNGVVQVKTTGLPTAKAEQYARSLFVQADGSPTPELLSIARERGLDPTNPKQQEQVIKGFVSDMSLRTKSGREETRKDSALDWKKFNLDASSRKTEEEKTPSINIVETPPIYNDMGRGSMDGYKTVSITNGPVIPSIYAKGKTYTNPRLDSYTITKSKKSGKGHIVAEITYEDTKGSSSKEFQGLNESTERQGMRLKTDIVILTQEDATKYARKLGFQNAIEMKKAAAVNKQQNSNSNASRPKTVTQNGYTYTWNEETQRYE